MRERERKGYFLRVTKNELYSIFMLLSKNVWLISRHNFLSPNNLKTSHIPIVFCKVASQHFFGGDGKLVRLLQRNNDLTGSQNFKGTSWPLNMNNHFLSKGSQTCTAGHCVQPVF